jgi:hypothetical protein
VGLNPTQKVVFSVYGWPDLEVIVAEEKLLVELLPKPRLPHEPVKPVMLGAVDKGASVNVGTGPVDALFQALCTAMNVKAELSEYRLSPVGGGPDAQGEVFVQVRAGADEVAYGRGISTDILAATAQALTQALTRLSRARQQVVAS